MKRKQKKAMAWCLSAALLVSTGIGLDTMPKSKATTDYGLQNPRVEMQTRDCIYFGNYWQEDTNGDGVANQKDEKTPIKWQILEEKNGELLLLADSVLDCKKYNEENEDVTWETSTIRTWLNDDFYEDAFSSEEKMAINESTVVNEDNPEYETEGGADTKDYVFLLSLSEITNPAYGFQEDKAFDDQARHGKATAYAKEQGCYTGSEDTSWWWLRSPGYGSNFATYVDSDGYVHYSGRYVGISGNGVRPALHLNLSSSVWTKGDEVTSDDKKSAITDTLPDGTSGTGSNTNTNGNAGTGNNTNGNGNTATNSITQSGGNGAGSASTVTAPAKVKSLKVKNKKKKTVTVSYKRVKGAAGYQLQYALNKKFTKGKKSKTVKKTSVTVKKLKKKKTYYFRVRAYKQSGKKKVYGKWSSVKKLKVKK